MNTSIFPKEHLLYLTVGTEKEIGLVCTGDLLEELIVGFLYNEGRMDRYSQIESLSISSNKEVSYAKVCLACSDTSSNAVIRTSGFGGAAVSNRRESEVRTVRRRFSHTYIRDCAKVVDSCAVRYATTGGIHCSALFDDKSLLAIQEDISRHSTLDKLAGYCIRKEISMEDTLLITSGRISSDMVFKAGKLGASVIASYSTASQQAYEEACKAGITLIAYLGKAKECICCGEERISE